MRRFELKAGHSSKFWEIESAGRAVKVRFGRIGTVGQTNSTTYKDPAAAQHAHDGLVSEKLGKGYLECAPLSTAAGSFVLTPVRLRTQGRLNVVRVMDRLAVIAGPSLHLSTTGTKFVARPLPHHAYLFHADDDAWFVGGGEGGFSVSEDQGRSWAPIRLPKRSGDLLAVCRDSNGTYWLGADGGAVFTSSNPRQGWRLAPQFSGRFAAVTDLREYDGQLYVMGNGVLVRDGDGARPLGRFGDSFFSRMIQAPSGALMLIGNDGVIWRSANGKSWKRVAVKAQESLEDFAWAGGSLFVVGGFAGGTGVVLESRDEGRTFKRRFLLDSKPYAIGSWGDGAFIVGQNGLATMMAAPGTTFRKRSG